MLFTEIEAWLKKANQLAKHIPAARKQKLDEIAAYISARRSKAEPVKLVFICTHNSRRSHMAHLWAAAALHQFGIDGVETYSGGTEATAFNPRAIAALERAGWKFKADHGENPIYRAFCSDTLPAIRCFSKRYDAPPNPVMGFIAMMTCSEADEACPVVFGAESRFALTFEDPKAYDDTPQESEMYDARCLQIATEVFYFVGAIAG
jgi:hypothetical protein